MATLEEVEDALRNAHAAGDVDAARQLADVYSSMQSSSMSMPKNSMAKQFAQGISDIGSGVIKAGGDVARGMRQMYDPATLLIPGYNEDDLAQEQKQAEAEYAPVHARSPLLSSIGEAVPSIPFKGGATALALKSAGLEGAKYGDEIDRAQRAGTAAASTLLFPALYHGAVKVGSKINQPFKKSNDPNLSLMKGLAEKYGIPLDAAQYTGNKSLQTISSILDELPFTSTKQAEMQAAQREAWQKELFTQGGENKPWSYNVRSPELTVDNTKYMRPTPEATYAGNEQITTPKEIGFMEEYNKALNAPKGKELSVPQSLQKYDYEPEFLGGAGGRQAGSGVEDVAEGEFRDIGGKTSGVTKYNMPASEAVHPLQDTMNNMKYRLNTLYRDVNTNNSLLVDKEFRNSLRQIRSEYRNSDLPSDLKGIVSNKINDLLGAPVGAKISGRVYQNIRSKLDNDMSTYKGNATVYEALSKTRNLLDRQMRSGMSAEDVAKLDEANKGWLVMKTIQESIDHNQGVIAPKKFFTELLKRDETKARTVYGKGEQDLVNLSKVGTHFIKPKKDTVSSWAKYPWAKLLTLAGAGAGGGMMLDAETTKDALKALAAAGTAGVGITAAMQNAMWKPKSYPITPLVEKEFPKIKKVGKGVGKAAPVVGYLQYLMSREGE